jgi:CDP-diacylglycerol--inositol 3-phosphatidyltransferase
MTSTRSRRSAAAAEAAPSESHHLTNGNMAIQTEKENIFLFAPNLIGYVRIVLAVVSLWYMPLHPR